MPSSGPTHLAVSAVGGQHHYGRQAALQRAVQVGEALNVEHVHLQGDKEGQRAALYMGEEAGGRERERQQLLLRCSRGPR
jgi:hypothetical protein